MSAGHRRGADVPWGLEEELERSLVDQETINRGSRAHTYLLFLLHTPIAANSTTLVLRPSVVPFGFCSSGLRLSAVM